MPLDGFRSVSNGSFGSLVTRITKEAVPYESGIISRNVRFKAKGVQTRNGLSQTCSIPSTYRVGGGGVFGLPTTNEQIPLFFGSNSTQSALYKETPVGSGLTSLIGSLSTPNLYADMTFAYGRAFIAYGNLIKGLDSPKQYDGTNYDSVSLPPVTVNFQTLGFVGTGNIEVGTRWAVVLYKTRHGYISGADLQTVQTIIQVLPGDANKELQLGNIPVSSDSSVIARVLAFTVAGASSAGPYYYIPDAVTVSGIAMTSTVLNDNTSTSITVNFTDDFLQGSSDVSSPVDFFDKILLPKQAAVYFSPSNRRLIWCGGEDDATIFRVSEPDDPDTYLGTTGFIKPSQNDGERAICAREFRSQLYLFKETAGFLTYNDSVNPSDWTIEKRWDNVGPVGPWAVDVNEQFMVILDRSGVYLMDGSIPSGISDEISSNDSSLWSRVNFSVKQKFWVHIDTNLNEIHVGVALDQAQEVSHILRCNYLLGLKPTQRKWSIDTLPTTKMVEVTRNLPASPNPAQLVDQRIATSQILHLSSNFDGQINLVDPASYMDNSNGIDSFYQTGFHEEEGMMQIGGVGVNAKGQGLLSIYVYNDKSDPVQLTRQLPQNNNLLAAIVKTRGVAPWFSVGFSNNGVAGSWFDVSRCDLYVRTMFKTRRTSLGS